MAAFETRIEVTDTLTPGLAALVKAGGNLRQPMADIAAAVYDNTATRFAQEFGPDGVPWETSREALKEGRRTLYKTGALFRAIKSDFGDDHAAVGVEETAGPAIYAKIHQFGGTIKARDSVLQTALKTPFGYRQSVTIPARPYLGIESRDLTDIERIILGFLGKAAEVAR